MTINVDEIAKTVEEFIEEDKKWMRFDEDAHRMEARVMAALGAIMRLLVIMAEGQWKGETDEKTKGQ